MTGSPATPPVAPAVRRNAAPRAIVLTSHPPSTSTRVIPIHWGAADPVERGPVIATLHEPAMRNAIGTHAGAYSLYRALAIAAGQLASEDE